MIKTIRMHQGLVVYLLLLWLTVVAATAAVLAAWAILLAAAVGMVLLVALNLRAVLYWNHFHRGARLYQDGQFFPAEVELRAAQAIAETFSTLDPRRGQLLDALAALHRVQGNYNEAETIGQQALTLNEQIWGDHHPRTRESMQNLGNTYLDIARYPKAEPLFHKVHNQLKGQESVETARCLQSLGRLWFEQGRYARAEPFLQRAWLIAQKTTVTTGRLRGSLCRQMALLNLRLDKVPDAERLANDALALAEQGSLGGLTSQLAQGQALDLLAQVRLKQGRLAEADTLAGRSLEILENAVGPNTPIVADTLLTLASIALFQKRWQDAESQSRHALKLREEYLAPEHPALAECLETLARSLPPLGRLEEAELHLQHAQQIRSNYDPLRLV